MIKISASAVAAFTGFTALALGLGTGTDYTLTYLISLWGNGGEGAEPSTLAILLLSYGWVFVLYRILLWFMPHPTGHMAPESRAEWASHLYTLIMLIYFFPLIRTNFTPTPLMRVIYLALGAKIGDNSYSAGALLDPSLTTIGNNSIVGHDAVVFAHAIEGNRYSFSPVRIGDNVTIGTKSIVMSGVEIGDYAIICAGAVVTKDTVIGRGEIWGGVPARKLKTDPSPATPQKPKERRRILVSS